MLLIGRPIRNERNLYAHAAQFLTDTVHVSFLLTTTKAKIKIYIHIYTRLGHERLSVPVWNLELDKLDQLRPRQNPSRNAHYSQLQYLALTSREEVTNDLMEMYFQIFGSKLDNSMGPIVRFLFNPPNIR